MIKAIIFDFDGVILETFDIKLRGFLHVFRAYPPDIKEKVKLMHLENGGMSRFAKFRIIFEQFLKKPLNPALEKQLGEEFSAFCYHEVLNAPFVKGMETFLEWAYRKYDLFIVSGTPEEEIRAIVHDRGLTKYFQGVFGSPQSKGNLCRMILKNSKYLNTEVIFIGDALNDLKGAEESGVGFIAKVSTYNEMIFDNKDVLKIPDFLGFEEVLTNIK